MMNGGSSGSSGGKTLCLACLVLPCLHLPDSLSLYSPSYCFTFSNIETKKQNPHLYLNPNFNRNINGGKSDP